jgi:DNA mismatch repair protein MutL
VVIGGPELFRSDRRLLYVFANGRRIQDYSLMQAMEYGTQGWFPNGVHPIGAVYITVNPALADFNIHPAKREARFRDQGAIHHALSVNLRDFCHHSNVQKAMQTGQKTQERESDYGLLVAEALSNTVPAHGPATYDKAVTYNADKIGGMDFAVIKSEEAPAYGNAYGAAYSGIRYAGRAFGLFIIIERGDKLFLIDQHAAHERILYNRFLAGSIPRQELLVPIVFTADSAEADNFLEAKREELAKLAIEIERDGNGWRIDALPAGWRMSDAETARAILELQNAGENIAERWAATLCCHQAIRDGDCIDEAAALALAEEAFALPDPHCPHGRPVWTDISREALCKAVRRIR